MVKGVIPAQNLILIFDSESDSVNGFNCSDHSLLAVMKKVNEFLDRFAAMYLTCCLLEGIFQQKIRGHEDNFICSIKFFQSFFIKAVTS